jgi:hypothetical protein
MSKLKENYGNPIKGSDPFIFSGRMPRNGALPPSTNAPRVSIGKGPGNPHFDLRVGS